MSKRANDWVYVLDVGGRSDSRDMLSEETKEKTLKRSAAMKELNEYRIRCEIQKMLLIRAEILLFFTN